MNAKEEKIRRRAYEIWQQEGCPQGDDLKHWLQAFKELGAEADKKLRKPAVKKSKTAGGGETKAAPTAPSSAKLVQNSAKGRAREATRH